MTDLAGRCGMSGYDAPPPGLADTIRDALAARMADDHTAVGEAVGRICAHGDRALFAACVGWAHVFAAAYNLDTKPGEWTQLETDVRPDSPEARRALWAGRMVAAAANHDTATALALFDAVPDGDELAQCVDYLLAMTAQAVQSGGAA